MSKRSNIEPVCLLASVSHRIYADGLYHLLIICIYSLYLLITVKFYLLTIADKG